MVSISIMVYPDWEQSSQDIVLYIQVVFGADILLILLNCAVIILTRRKVRKVFTTEALWTKHLSLYVRKCLSVFPISDDMENELAHFEEEEVMLARQATEKKRRRSIAKAEIIMKQASINK